MSERELNIYEKVLEYLLGPKRDNVYIESESQLTKKPVVYSSLVGTGVAAKLEELKRELNPPPNTSQ